MISTKLRNRILNSLYLNTREGISELEKIKNEVEDDEIILLIDSFMYMFGHNIKISDLNEIISEINQLNEQLKNDNLYIYLLGMIYRNKKEYEKAEECYKKTIENDKDFLYSFNSLGNLYRIKKDYKKSEEYFRKAIQRDEDYVHPYNGLGILYCDIKNYEKAEEYYKKAIKKNESYVHPYYNLGILYRNKKEYEKSEEFILKALEKDNDYLNAYVLLGILYIDKHKYAKAEEYFLKVVEKDEDYVRGYQYLGILYKNMKKYTKAKGRLNQAKKIASKNKNKFLESILDRELEKINIELNKKIKEKGEKKADFIKKTGHLFESIEKRKKEFNRFITDETKNEKIFKLEVLRRWNSYTPIIANNFHMSKGGGYFLNINGHGCVIDPGFNFIDNFKGSGKCFQMIDSVIISHAHNDHESDLESILTLLYKYNEEVKGLDIDSDSFVYDEDNDNKFKGTIRYDIAERENKSISDVTEDEIEKEFLTSPRRKEIKIYIPESIYKKYLGMLDLYRNSNYQIVPIKKEESKKINDIEVNFIWAKHRDIISKEHSLGFYLVYGNNALIYTGDTGWSDEMNKYYKNIKSKLKDKSIILIAHLGGFKEKEEKFKYKNSNEDECTYGNHLGRLGLVGINEVLEPKVCIVSEFGEEFKGSRIEICEILNNLFVDTYFIPADIGLSYNLTNDMINAITRIDTYAANIKKEYYEEIPYENVETTLLRADYSLHYYDKSSFKSTDDLIQALSKLYYTSSR